MSDLLPDNLSDKYCEGWCDSGGKGSWKDCTGCEVYRLEAQLQQEREANARLKQEKVEAQSKAFHAEAREARLREAAERQITLVAEAAVEKLTELQPDAGWDAGVDVAKLHIRAMYRKAALAAKGEG